MISFESFRDDGGRPVYLQIVYFVKRGVLAGGIKDGDELPSRRMLSALLGINPNTVQRAFKMLEDEGLIESRAGAKSYMRLSPQSLENIRVQLLKEDIFRLTEALKASGVSRDEAVSRIERYWDEDPGAAGPEEGEAK